MRRLCNTPGCAGTVTYRGYCATHAAAKERQTERKGRSLYKTAKWRNTRKAVLAAKPLCAAEGCGEIATDVDHIVPLPTGEQFAMSNLAGMCKSCHSKKTMREMREGLHPLSR